jgi:hypothetical protein
MCRVVARLVSADAGLMQPASAEGLLIDCMLPTHYTSKATSFIHGLEMERLRESHINYEVGITLLQCFHEKSG